MDIILGPPGTGKTTTLLREVEDALERGIPPDRIGYVTFTKKGANEAIERACKRFNLEPAQLPHFRTLHSLCYRQLGVTSGDMLVGKKFFDFANYARIRVTGRAWSDDGLLTGFEVGDRILFMENLARIRQTTLREQYEKSDDNIPWREVERVANALATFKAAHGLLDYTDLLREFVNHGNGIGLHKLLVDEGQDLSRLQWSVVELLARGCKEVTVAGDDDQAIYRWAGADVEYLIGMEGNARVLGQSFRVPPLVQAAANGIISGVTNRRQKKWKAKTGGDGVVERLRSFDDTDMGMFTNLDGKEGTIMVLTRNIYVMREQVEPVLRKEGIVYERNGKSSINMGMLRAAVVWEDLKKGEAIPLGDVREMYEFISANTGIKKGYKGLKTYGEDPDIPVTMRDLIETGGLKVDPTLIWHEALDKLPQEDMSYMLAARRRGEKLRGATPRVKLSTIHSAKGGEADHVVVMTEMAKLTHAEMMKEPEDERRVWYVAATRAREKLTVVSSETNRECPWL